MPRFFLATPLLLSFGALDSSDIRRPTARLIWVSTVQVALRDPFSVPLMQMTCKPSAGDLAFASIPSARGQQEPLDPSGSMQGFGFPSFWLSSCLKPPGELAIRGGGTPFSQTFGETALDLNPANCLVRAMDSALAGAAVGGLLGIAGTVLGGFLEARKLKQERFAEREHGFEVAQVGYRACYRKFLDNVATFQRVGPPTPDSGEQAIDADTLLRNFREAAFIGDPEVIAELERYWPNEQRAMLEPPTEPPPASLEAAMFQHGSRSLTQQLSHLKHYSR